MQVANAWLVLNELGSNVQLKRITPAEAQVVKKQFGFKSAGSSTTTNPMSHLDILKDDVKRSSEQEFERLSHKYGTKLIEELFPGVNPKIPETFKEAGFEATEEVAPRGGKMHEILPLTAIPKNEQVDEQSIKELNERNKVVEAQNKTIADLQKTVAELIARLSKTEEK